MSGKEQRQAHQRAVPSRHATRAKKTVPLTSEEQLKKTRTETNNQNRQRSKQHERAIAKYLRGSRTPASGALQQYKGDVRVPFENGDYLIECKMSSQKKGNDPTININFQWLPKLVKDTVSMNAKFGVLITHFMRASFDDDLVFIRVEDAELLIHKYQTPYAGYINDIINNAPVFDMRYTKQGKQRTGYNLRRSEMKSYMYGSATFKGAIILTPHGRYLVLTLVDFRDSISHM